VYGHFFRPSSASLLRHPVLLIDAAAVALSQTKSTTSVVPYFHFTLSRAIVNHPPMWITASNIRPDNTIATVAAKAVISLVKNVASAGATAWLAQLSQLGEKS
jgi:hypothetical protein